MSLLDYQILSESIGLITLQDPDRLNAMSEEMAEEMRQLVSRLRGSSDLPRVLIITGAGRSFSAGGDLHMLEAKAQKSIKQNTKEMLEFYHSFLSILSLDVPLIAAVNGHAIGAGLCLACACDFRVVSRKAKLGFTFSKLGLYPGMGATYFLPAVVGHSSAAELMLTGRMLSGEQSVKYGITQHLVDEGEVLEESKRIAAEILACGPLATRNLLISLRGDRSQLEEKLLVEAREQARSYASEEFLEGIAATREKRKASWQ